MDDGKNQETVPDRPTADYYVVRNYIHNHDKLATMGEAEIQAKIDEIRELSLSALVSQRSIRS